MSVKREAAINGQNFNSGYRAPGKKSKPSYSVMSITVASLDIHVEQVGNRVTFSLNVMTLSSRRYNCQFEGLHGYL